MEKKQRITALVEQLNMARRAYEQEDREIMSNAEYDALYDELVALEKETGIVMATSPTVNVGYEVVSSLPKEKHPDRMLSLDKTKSPEALAAWLGDQEGLLSWKMDGLTIVLTYEQGSLSKAVTRGNGDVGEVITPSARVFTNIPHRIPYDGRLVIRGEAVISYDTFERINGEIADAAARYKNPRNLCSGTVRQLDSAVTASRGVEFYGFSLVSAEGGSSEPYFENSREKQMKWLEGQGFDIVESRRVSADTVESAVAGFAEEVKNNRLPSDGLVLIYDDIAYGKSLGRTAKFPRDAIAFKWQDETAETRLLYIEWSPSRTGLINPVAVFEPVELEGTTVSRASVHNVSILRELKLGEGDIIEVYKANMIIPQILKNHTGSGTIEIPEACPVCGGRTELKTDNDATVLICTNPECQAKQLKSFAHFVSRNAMNIDGLSDATLEKLIGSGIVRDFADIFRLGIGDAKEKIAAMEGFGEISADNMVNAAEKASHTTCDRLLNALGIPGIGAANAYVIAEATGFDWQRMMDLTEEELLEIPGIGDVLAKDYVAYFRNKGRRGAVEELLPYLTFQESPVLQSEKDMAGITFVVTGSLAHFGNRDELKELIKTRGGKVAGSVSGNTDYLINNDSTSSSSKNKKAKELGVKIITEEEFLDMYGIDY